MTENLKTIGGALALAIAIRILFFEAFEIEGPSMEPSLLNGDRVVVAKFMYGLFLPFTNEALFTWGQPSVGDVVIVRSPMDNIDIVKRVVGVPGDIIEVKKQIVYRNGKPIPRQSYGACKHDPCKRYGGSTEQGPCVVWQETLEGHSYATSFSPDDIDMLPSTGKISVPEDSIFIMGDHRDHSNDSRFFGVVPINRVKGKSLSLYWSSDASTVDAEGKSLSWFDQIRWCRITRSVE